MPRKKKNTKKRPSRNGQLIRALSILKDLLYKKRPPTVEKLATRYDVHQKTIRRDIKAIEASGFKIKRSSEEGKTLPLSFFEKKLIFIPLSFQ